MQLPVSEADVAIQGIFNYHSCCISIEIDIQSNYINSYIMFSSAMQTAYLAAAWVSKEKMREG
jgi:hypothetical protein